MLNPCRKEGQSSSFPSGAGSAFRNMFSHKNLLKVWQQFKLPCFKNKAQILGEHFGSICVTNRLWQGWRLPPLSIWEQKPLAATFCPNPLSLYQPAAKLQAFLRTKVYIRTLNKFPVWLVAMNLWNSKIFKSQGRKPRETSSFYAWS